MDLLVDFLLNFHGPMPYLVILAMLLICGLGLPIPEDIILFCAGLMSYYGVSNVWGMIGISMVGVLVGDSIIFYLGAHYGRKLTKKWLFHKLLPDDRLNAVKVKLDQGGDKVLFAARFMPGLRAPIYFSAGTLHVPYRKFPAYDGSAALISVPAIVGAVYYFGDELDRVVRVIQRIENGIVFAIFAVIFAVFAKWYISHRKLKRA